MDLCYPSRRDGGPTVRREGTTLGFLRWKNIQISHHLANIQSRYANNLLIVVTNLHGVERTVNGMRDHSFDILQHFSNQK